MTEVVVELGARSYPVRIVSQSAAGFASFVAAGISNHPSVPPLEERQAHFIVDSAASAAARTLADVLRPRVSKLAITMLEGGEKAKDIGTVVQLWGELAGAAVDRRAIVVAVGGGAVCDVAGFVAGTYLRGLPLIMVPTTLLAMVDAAIGGKNGINLTCGKNLVGTFHQPAGVWVDSAFLESLPDAEYRSGLAEVVKYGVIEGGEFWRMLVDGVADIRRREPAILAAIVARCVEIKARLVGCDERDINGAREMLNVGHTVGHAIETVTGYGTYRHGEAVAIGMVAECRLAEALGWIDAAQTNQLVALLEALDLPSAALGLDSDALINAMRHDKKNHPGKIGFALLKNHFGNIERCQISELSDIKRALDESFAH